MGYSVLTTVTNDQFNGQRFYLYQSIEDGMAVFTEDEANNLADILSQYPSVFSDMEVVPRENDEIKYLELNADSVDLSMSMNDVLEDCPGLQASLESDFDNIIVGIDRKYTYDKTFENN